MKEEYTAVEGALIDLLLSFPVMSAGSGARHHPLTSGSLTNARREAARGHSMVLLDQLINDFAAQAGDHVAPGTRDVAAGIPMLKGDAVADAELGGSSGGGSDEDAAYIDAGANDCVVAGPVHSSSPQPHARSRSRSPVRSLKARPRTASLSSLNGSWIRWCLSRATCWRGKSSKSTAPSDRTRSPDRIRITCRGAARLLSSRGSP
jgi:hypothetical protein